MAPPLPRKRLLACLVTGVAALFLAAACSGPPKEKSPAKVAQLSFLQTTEVVTAEKDGPRGDGDEAAAAIALLMTDWYQRAFVDPRKATETDGLLAPFTEDARARAKEEIDSLSLASVASELRAVEPSEATMKVTVYVGEDGSASHAVADVAFRGSGDLVEGGLPLQVVQKAVFFLRRDAGEWRIFSYQARNDTAQRRPEARAS